MRFATLELVAAGLMSCAPTPEQELISQAKKNVLRQLRDPDSARFSDVEAFLPDKAVCGKVNSKNGYGGYGGDHDFAVTPATTIVDDDGEFAATKECTRLLNRSADRINAEAAARGGAEPNEAN